MSRISSGIVIGILLSATSVGAAPPPIPTATPDRMDLTVQKAEISSNDIKFFIIFDNLTPDPVPLTSSTNPIFNPQNVDPAQIPVGAYRVIRLTVQDISWHATWKQGNPSPCDGKTDNSTATGSVNLGGHTEFYFKTPDLGGNTLAYYLANPPFSGYVGDANHPFVMASPIQVIKDLPTTVNLVFGVTDTLTCDSVGTFDRTSGGPKATLSGPATRLMGADGIYFDSNNQEVGITNSMNNSVTVYDRTALTNTVNDTRPTRPSLIGPDTRLNGPAGIALHLDQDPAKDEIVVANTGNDSVTVYSRTAIENANPLRTIAGSQTGLSGPNGIFVDAGNNEILVTNSGNDSVTIYGREVSENALPYRTIHGDLTGLSRPCGLYVDTERGEIGVANTDTNSVTIYRRNDVNSIVGISKGYPNPTDPVRDPGALLTKTFALDFAETVVSPDITINLTHSTTLAELSDMINNDSGNYLISPGISRVTATITPTTPYRLIITSNLVEPATNVTVGGTLLTEIHDFWSLGDVSPVRTITGLSSPCGLYLDTTNNEIAVANSGNDSITIYDRDFVFKRSFTVSGPVGIYVDNTPTRDEIGVVHKGQSVVMAQPPSIFPVSANEDASLSAIASGYSYNVTLYGVDIKGVDGDGNTIPFVFAERGIATFDASAAPWPGFNLTLETQIGRQISKPDCLTGADVGITYPGFFGVNHDGSFYAFLPGIHGSLQGAFLPDGTTFVGSMYDDSNKLLLVYGVRNTGNLSPYLTSNGTSSGGGAHYAYTTYSNRIPNYLLWIGMAATDASNLNSMSGDTNFVTAIGGLRYNSDDAYLRINTPQSYLSRPGGFLEIFSEGLSGALTTDGSTLLFARDTVTKDDNGCPNEVGFGMGLRQSPAGTFTTSSIKGTYFLAAFGDRYEIDLRTRLHRSTAVRLSFNGAGSVEIARIENAAGRISMDQASFTYKVHPRLIPSHGDTRMQVDVVDIFNRTTIGPYATALIGKNGKSLGFFLNLNPGGVDLDAPNPTRLLGLAVFQHP